MSPVRQTYKRHIIVGPQYTLFIPESRAGLMTDDDTLPAGKRSHYAVGARPAFLQSRAYELCVVFSDDAVGVEPVNQNCRTERR